MTIQARIELDRGPVLLSVLLSVLLGAAGSAAAWGQQAGQPPALPDSDPTSPALADEVDLAQWVPVWVDDLDAPELRTRRDAERQLKQAGPAAAEFLPVLTDHLSIEAQERLARVQTRWQANRLDEQTKAVTVRLAEAETLDQALDAISAASGVAFQHHADGNQAIVPTAAPLGFWNAVDWVLDQSGLDINFYAGDRTTLALVPRGPTRTSRLDSAAYAGIYRLEPTVVTARRVLAAPQLNSLNVTMTISWQPNRTPIGLTLPLAELSGQLDNELPLRAQPSSDQIDVATSAELAQSEFFLPLQLPDGSPEQIARLSGTIRALLPGKRATFELDLNEPAATTSRDAMTVSIEEIRTTGPLHEIRLGIALDDAGRALESHRQWIFENEAYVVTADGARVDHLGFEVYRQTAGGVGVSYLFDLGADRLPEGARLQYQSPTSVKQTEVPFVLTGIPLP